MWKGGETGRCLTVLTTNSLQKHSQRPSKEKTLRHLLYGKVGVLLPSCCDV